MSGSLIETPCLIENAWICLSLYLEDAHNCKSVMHFLRIYSIGFSGTGVVDKELAEKHEWFLGL